MRVATRDDQNLAPAERTAVNRVLDSLEHLLSLRSATKEAAVEISAVGIAGCVDAVTVRKEPYR
jgi:hypothetical protein